MEARFMEPFLTALSETFEMFSGKTVQKKDVTTLENPLVEGTDIHIFLGVTGDLQGAIFFSAARENGLQLASSMAGMKFEQYDEIATSALQELLNITSGRALTTLGDMGIDADITPPSFLTGESMELRVPYPLVSLCLLAGDAEFYMNLSLKKAQVKNVLITDDKAATREQLSRLIQKNGYNLANMCSDGSECLDTIAEYPPDIILMDISMPVMDGLEALERIKRDFPGIKVVMVTAFGERDNVQRAMQLGADGFVLKPFTEKSLLTVLRGL